MNLAAGTRLGPYQIVNAIGAGGMGVVYRADDSRLRRNVAIKLLPTAKGEYFRRFEREARTIGGLNHPNLLTLFDVGEHEGTPYLVTEMLEGESLRARLLRGPLRLREAIQIAADVARGLAAAHDAGVIHRDVKPDNIYLTTEGRTKILDFGIAKLRRSSMEMKTVEDIGNVPTESPTTSETGVVLGTPGYMAPEQLEGDTVDERTDIFALGVVLYEMICGKRAFAAESSVEESYAILRTTPDPPRGATKGLARVVLRCLEKKPDARFQSATDLAFALDELDASTDPVARISKVAIENDPTPARTVRDRPVSLPLGRGWWLAIVGVAAVGAGIGGLLVGRSVARPPAPAAPSPAPFAAWPSLVEGGPEYRRITFHGETATTARFADNGASVLYATKRAGTDQILRTQVANPSILLVQVQGRLIDVSSKGELAVLTDAAGGTLSRVLEGAGPRAVADHVTEATWLPDDTLAVVRDALTLEYPIGTPIVRRTTGQIAMLRASPDGQWFAFADQPAAADTRGKIVIVDRKGAQIAASRDESGIEGVAWSPDGSEVWFSNGQTLYGLDRSGRQRVVLRGAIRTTIMDTRAGKALIAASDVRLKMFTGPRAGGYREVGWFDSSEVEGVSRDGTTIAFVEAAGTGLDANGYAHFVRRGTEPAAQVTNAYRATLVPDASALITIASPTQLTKVPTGVGAPTPIPIAPIANLEIGDRPAVSWSGRYVVVRGAEAGKPTRLWRIDLAQPAVLPIESSPSTGLHPISPDGSVIAIARDGGGIELVTVAGTTPSRVLEGSPGEQPVSFHDSGAKLFTMRLVDDSIQVDQRDLATGARTSWVKISPEQRPVYFSVALSGAGEIVTYSTNSDASDLYVIEPTAR